MESGLRANGNPFVNPRLCDEEQAVAEDPTSTLIVGRDAFLTLGTDSLIILGWYRRRRQGLDMLISIR